MPSPSICDRIGAELGQYLAVVKGRHHPELRRLDRRHNLTACGASGAAALFLRRFRAGRITASVPRNNRDALRAKARQAVVARAQAKNVAGRAESLPEARRA